MKTAIIFAVITLALAVAAPAQTPQSMHCSHPTEKRTVCRFDDGSVNVTEIQDDGKYDSDWYTAEEWSDYLNTFKFDGTLRPDPVARHSTEEETILATARLCKSGTFDKSYCTDFRVGKQGPKHATLSQKFWDCALSDSDVYRCKSQFGMYEETELKKEEVKKEPTPSPTTTEVATPALPKFTGKLDTKAACNAFGGRWIKNVCLTDKK